MSDSTTNTNLSIASAFIAGLFANLLKDEAAVLQPVADGYLNNVISDPSPDNVVAQSLVYQTQALAVLPKVESVGIFDTASAIKTFIDAQIPALVAQATTALNAQTDASTASGTQSSAA